MTDALNLFELEALANAQLEPMARDYYRSGAHDELTLARNQQAFRELCLHYRVLTGVGDRDLSTEVLGRKLSLPVITAPTAFHGLAHEHAELATAWGTAAAGSTMILSTLSNTDVERVAEAARGELWFQLYVYRDRAATKALVQRAEAAGAKALVLTVDAPLLGTRERDVRNGFHLRGDLDVRNLTAERMELPPAVQDSGLAAYFYRLLDPDLSWDDVAWLRSISSLPVLVKGIVRADDALLAVQHGASGIVVSNHGGRQLDTSPATIEVLPRIADAVQGAVPLLLDGGVRRGTDVVKALALGARAVLIGRPVLWGLTLGGKQGVERVYEMLRTELDLAMALCGAKTVADLDRGLITGG